jgi:hypothetical protein
MESLVSQRGEAMRHVSLFVGAVIVRIESGPNVTKRETVAIS